MKEVSQAFQKGFTLGLRPTKALGPSAEYLWRCLNMLPTKLGLEPRSELVNPIAETPEDEFPFPALYVLSRHTLLFTSDGLYEVDADWGLTHIMSQKWGDLPHIADFMDFVVFSTPSGAYSVSPNKVASKISDSSFTVCANFNGQLLVGDCSLPNGSLKVSSEVKESLTPVGGKDVVAWAKIGALDWEYALGNDVGWAPMPYNGQVLGLMPLGKNTIVVYMSDGIAKLTSISEPTIGYGVSAFDNVGVLNRNCFAGYGDTHIFLGSDYALYKIADSKLLSDVGNFAERLGYEEFLGKLVNPVVTFEPTKKCWWIGDKHNCYVYNGVGLGESSETPTHISMIDGRVCSVIKQHGLNEAVVETNNISFDSRGFKTLMCVESDVTSAKQVKGYTFWRSEYLPDEKVSRAIRLDPRGAFYPIVSGTEIRVGFRSEDFRRFSLTKIWLRFKNTDKTFARGVINAGQPPNQ